MYIKIYDKSQLILLEQINPLLGKYRLPQELLEEVEKVFRYEKIGKKGFIAILMNPVRGNIQGILNILDCYPQTLRICSDAERIENIRYPITQRKSLRDKCSHLTLRHIIPAKENIS